MFGFLYTELLKTKSEAQYNDARAALENSGLKYRSYQKSAESTQLTAATMSHLGHRPKNPMAYDSNNPGLGPGAIREITSDGSPEDVEYVLEVRKKDLLNARKLIG